MSHIPGKQVASRFYLHLDALKGAEEVIQSRIAAAQALAGLTRGDDYNLVRLELEGLTIALLHYPGFFDEPFPALAASWLVDPEAGTATLRTYADSLNPPILHRKELLLSADHPRRAEFAALTAACESVGLFDEPTRIGYRRQWLDLVREKGYRIEGHALVPLGNEETEGEARYEPQEATQFGQWQAARQLTALVRYNFSAPVQTLARYGFLDGRHRVFDYGCGRGDDLRGLAENGLQAAGWDPFYAPDGALAPADIVNLGFVINVIEDPEERLTALTRAWSLAERLLVVSVMLTNQNDPRGVPFRDGVMTQRGTFQRYYSQAEIKTYIKQVLDEEPIPVAPGVLYIFRDKDAEQQFLVARYRGRRLHPLSPSLRPRMPCQRVERPARRDRGVEKYDAYREPLERLWAVWLDLGRTPDKSEVADLVTLVEGFGSLGKALRFLAAQKGQDVVEEEVARAAQARIADLEVYFALQQFSRRRAYKQVDQGLQRDIKAFFGDYPSALEAGRQQLFRISDTEAIAEACRTAAEHGLGWLEPGAALQLPTRLVAALPSLLRIYVGAASMLYGDIREADLVKIHIGSGKLSLMRYDDFDGLALPRMVERVKIKLREQDIDYFAYGEDFEAPYLYHKSRYMNEEFPGYPEQVEFDETLTGLGLCDLSGYGPPPAVFDAVLARHRWALDGLALVRTQTLSDLDEPCGRFFTYRQLIACGETQAATGLANLPTRPESYTALHDLADAVLDPVIDYFGMIRLSYGFCSAALAKRIPGRIDPQRDQHAAHELNRLGKPICPRLGAAVDFRVEDESMLEVAQWVAANTPFDRLYYYGDDQPLHVSHGPGHNRQVVLMLAGKSGRLVPKCLTKNKFLKIG
jgi:DNA phosphorothioation-associated putative methyltransferase